MNAHNKIPTHVAIIMDGNGRWAKKKMRPRLIGHQEGAKNARIIVEVAANMGIKHLTLYAFSKENWKRPLEEINALMSLLINSINKNEKKLIESNVKMDAIGDIGNLPSKVIKSLKKMQTETAVCTGLNLHLAINYSSYWEIMLAVKKIASRIKNENFNIDQFDVKEFEKFLSTNNIPHPDLLIRTSGEYRLSNFLLWQLAYTELYFTNILWPDFGEEEFRKAINDFQKRERRFGQTSFQL